MSALALFPSIAGAAIEEFDIPTAASGVQEITSGPDGNLWFTESSAGKIGRITPSGVIAEFPLSNPASQPWGITAGPDGALWFTERAANRIGRITTAGEITEFELQKACGGGIGGVFTDKPTAITAGPDGALWFTGVFADSPIFCAFAGVGRITTSGQISRFGAPNINTRPSGAITTGPDGNLWFTASGVLGNLIARMTTLGGYTEFAASSSFTSGITVGPDGALWFTESSGPKIGRITTAGVITDEYTVAGGSPGAITQGPDEALWFTNSQMGSASNQIGRITTTGDFTTPFVIPSSNPFGSAPLDITMGPDGALWITEQRDNQIGRLTQAAGKLEVKKTLSPTNDPGRFNLQIDSTTRKADAANGDTTDEQSVTAASHTVGETAGTATSLSDYASTISCRDQNGTGSEVASASNAGPLTVTVVESADVVCTISNTRKLPPTPVTGKLEVKKALSPANDPGRFNLQIDGTTDPDAGAIGDGGSTGEQTLNTGNHTVGETAPTGTRLTNYTSAISCREQNGTGTEIASAANAGPLTVSIAEGADVICTITNTRNPPCATRTPPPGRGSLCVLKHVIHDDGGRVPASRFIMRISGQSPSPSSFHGREGGRTTTLLPGSYSVSETGPRRIGYAATFSPGCSGTITAGETKICAVINDDITPTLTVRKILAPASDPGRFDLVIDGIVQAFGVGDNGTTGPVPLRAGHHRVSERAAGTTSLRNYKRTFVGACNFRLRVGENRTCVIVNESRLNLAAPIATLTVPLEAGSL